MKEIIVLGCLGVFANCVAAETEEVAVTPENGFYLGIGLTNQQDKIDWSGSAVARSEPGWKITKYSNSSRKFNGQVFLGYKRHEPLFWAIECGINFGKKSISKKYTQAEVDGISSAVPAMLNIEVGDDAFIGAKIGKTFRNKVTPYISLGAYRRKSNFDWEYLPDVNEPAFDEYTASGSYKSAAKLILAYGVGCLVHLDSKTDVKLEYCYKSNCNIDYSTVVDTTQVDESGYPRKFQLKTSSHCISLGISRTIVW